MEVILETVEVVLHYLVEICSIALEFTGIFVMLNAAFMGLKRYLNREEDGPQLEEGILTALEFMMCGEVIKTVTAHNVDDYIALGAIIILRFALAFEVQWEMKSKVRQMVLEKQLEQAEKKEAPNQE